ncbi:MAG: gfo/Idh/MocA family oxidoreductase [Chloroflexi bacterium]|nr:gfo/Idh/MocA family oxidoreductase [Chloroflexota bacterium]
MYLTHPHCALYYYASCEQERRMAGLVVPKAEVLRFGIAGLGIASTQILPVFADRPHLQVTAAADIRPDALKRFSDEFHAETYTSVADMCESPSVDAIYVCSPNHLHAEHVITAAEHHKHVIVEKPMALTLEECEAMNVAAEHNGMKLLCGHTHSFDPPIRKMRQIVMSGELGHLRMINTWNFNEFMYRPRMPHELDPTVGGNVVYNQGPHQVDVVRLIGGGMVRSVRAMTGVWDPARRTEGAWCAYIEFENGTPASLVYNGYGHLDTAEFFWWIGEGGTPRDPDTNLQVRAALKAARNEESLKEAQRYGGARSRFAGAGHAPPDEHQRRQPFFGLTIASCEHGDIRQSPAGLSIYGDDRTWEVPVPLKAHGRAAELEELYGAVVNERPVFHDGRWGMATLEVVLAIMQSANERREIFLSHQVPAPEDPD